MPSTLTAPAAAASSGSALASAAMSHNDQSGPKAPPKASKAPRIEDRPPPTEVAQVVSPTSVVIEPPVVEQAALPAVPSTPTAPAAAASSGSALARGGMRDEVQAAPLPPAEAPQMKQELIGTEATSPTEVAD